MKVFGNTGKGKRRAVSKNSASRQSSSRSRQESYDYDGYGRYDEEAMEPKKSKAEIDKMIADYQRKKRKRRRTVLTIFIILAILTAGGYALLKSYIRPPEVKPAPRPSTNNTNNDNNTGDEPQKPEEEDPAPDIQRDTGKYTFIVMGTDDGNGNTDTIMASTFDTKTHSLNVVSIPRDTLVNVSWYTKKANTLFAYEGTDGVVSGLSKVLGYEVDFYVIVDLEAFVTLVDAIGGVTYNVPDVEGNGQGMNYEDPYQDLYIHLSPGEQTLSGSEAVGIVRYRSGYFNADIGRIGTQQDFLMTVAKQILENKNSLNITDLVKIFLDYVQTDLDYGEVIWFAKEFLKVDAENIHFMTVPGKYDDYVNKVSYVTITVNEWLDMINEYLNPYDQPITEENLSIYTRDESGRLYVTDGNYEGDSSWGR